MRRPLPAIHALMASEAAAGVAVIAAAALALLAANLPATATTYDRFVHAALGPLPLHRWIDDALMALFFLYVGLEIRREAATGALATPARRRLPLLAAAAGMAVPALVYLAIAGGDPLLRRGWAIPAATDIAFALGVLSLLGRRIPRELRLLLAAIAIADDIGAVAIIAVGYTATIAPAALAGAALTTAMLALLGRDGRVTLGTMLALGALLWLFVLGSGIHPTIAGVVLAAAMPARFRDRLETALHGPVTLGIVPLFAFVNAGVALGGATVLAPLPLAIAAGLVLGKPVGILGAIGLAARTGVAHPPAGLTWRHLTGMALLAGIGFTMSLFIGGLAFDDPLLRDEVKIGVLAGSLIAATLGALVLASDRRPT